jgi:hypothetical protein
MLVPILTREETLLNRTIMIPSKKNKSNNNQVKAIRLLSMGVTDVDGAIKLRVTSMQLVLSTLITLVMESQDQVICGTF